MKIIKRYFQVWWLVTLAIFKADLSNRLAAGIFIFGKILRFAFFLGFLLLLMGKVKVLAGYNLEQVVFFFLTFNLIDITVQLLLRGVYHFRPLIVSGDFDLLLVRPINPLFTSLTAHTDILDLITLVPLVGYMAYFLIIGSLQFTLAGLILYLVLLLFSLLLALSFHILVLAIGIMTTEVDHLVWIYRDLSGMGRFSIDIYRESLRVFLTFFVPVGILMTFPAKALMGLLSPFLIFYAMVFVGLFFWLSLYAWKFALKRYSSASS